jgi:23S rRNA (cytosine1962-C5)-methyltransferase
VAEGVPGVSLDRYGPVLLAQLWPQADVPPGELAAATEAATAAVGTPLTLVVWDRGPRGRLDRAVAAAGRPLADALGAVATAVGHELGVAYRLAADPRREQVPLYLDLRAGRRLVQRFSRGRSVLNLFAYTCGVGVCAAAAGAMDVLNVDWSQSALKLGRANAALNGIPPDRFGLACEDVLAVLRQLAGLPLKGRGARNRRHQRFAPRQFDLVVLDPPPWSVGPYGAVDSARDYESLFKPALLATRPGGCVLAVNHSPQVERQAWLGRLESCAAKVGRPLALVEVVEPEADFPPLGEPLIKIAWLRTTGICTTGI